MTYVFKKKNRNNIVPPLLYAVLSGGAAAASMLFQGLGSVLLQCAFNFSQVIII